MTISCNAPPTAYPNFRATMVLSTVKVALRSIVATSFVAKSYVIYILAARLPL
jgi:hypothetical protein